MDLEFVRTFAVGSSNERRVDVLEVLVLEEKVSSEGQSVANVSDGGDKVGTRANVANRSKVLGNENGKGLGENRAQKRCQCSYIQSVSLLGERVLASIRATQKAELLCLQLNLLCEL